MDELKRLEEILEDLKTDFKFSSERTEKIKLQIRSIEDQIEKVKGGK